MKKSKLLVVLSMVALAAILFVALPTRAEAEEEAGFYYYIADDQAILSKYDGEAENVTIPATLGGYPVTVVSNQAFARCDTVISVVFPDSVKQIGMQAFQWCDNLTSVTFGNGLTRIGMMAFLGCPSLTSVELPDSATTIEMFAFSECENLTSVKVGKGVTDLSATVFRLCDKLAGIWVDEENEEYSSDDQGVLYNKDKTILLKVPDGVFDYTIPDCVTGIGQEAFFSYDHMESIEIGGNVEWISNSAFSYTKLTSVTIGDSVTDIGDYAFVENAKLTTVIIGTGVNEIGDEVFYGCNKVNVYYTGTQAQWDAITIGEGNPWADKVNIASYAQITGQPKTVRTADGQVAKVSVEAIGDGLTYTWYHKNTTATKYSKSSVTEATYSVKMSSTVNGRYVYCVVTDQYGNFVTSDVVRLYMGNPAKITTQPKSVIVAPGQDAKVTVKATGDGLKYTWQYALKGATKWTTASSKTNVFTSGKMSASLNGCRVRCLVTDSMGNKVVSNTAVLYMENTAKISAQPKSVKVAPGQAAKVAVQATGDGLKYQWYYAKKGSSSFKKLSGATKATYSVKMSSKVDGRKVYCKITDKYGNTVKTKTVTLKIDLIKASECTFKLSATSYTYNGKAKTPTVTVKNSAGKTLKKGTDYTVSYAKGRKNVGTYKITVKMKGNYTGTKTLTFKIVPKAASINKLTAKSKAILVKLNRVTTQSTGYQIQYSTSSKFTSTKTVNVTSYKTSSKTISGLKKGKKYYVRVRTYKTVGGTKIYSAWSAAKSVKTK